MAAHSKLRIIIDVNLWISFAIAKGIKTRFEEVLSHPQISIISSDIMIEELTRVLQYPKIKKLTNTINGFSSEVFIDLHRKSTCKITPKTIVELSPDENDNYLLSLAVDGKAHYLITGDKPHLLNFKIYNKTQIVTFAEFYSKVF